MEEKNELAIRRLTALWALHESGTGGLLHAIQMPFMGIPMAGIALLIISIICSLSENKWQTVSKSLLIVLLIKLAVSPHSPPTAYMAVTFQAGFAALIYSLIRHPWISAFLVGVIGVMESALQRLITLTLVFGQNLWTAIDDYGAGIAKRYDYMINVDSSQVLIAIYLGIYFLGGLFVATLIAKLTKKIQANRNNPAYHISIKQSDTLEEGPPKSGVKNLLPKLLVSVAALVLIYFTWFNPESPMANLGILVFGRALIIVLLWFMVLGPLVMKGIKRFLEKREGRVNSEVQEILGMLPHLRFIASKAWEEASIYRGPKFFYYFLFNLLMFSLHFKVEG